MKSCALVLSLAIALGACGPNGPNGAFTGHNASAPFEPFTVVIRNTTTDEQLVTLTTWNNPLRPVSRKISPQGESAFVVGEAPDGFSVYSVAWRGFKVFDRSQFGQWLVVRVDVPTAELVGEIRAR